MIEPELHNPITFCMRLNQDREMREQHIETICRENPELICRIMKRLGECDGGSCAKARRAIEY
jgi:hypothetical protein